MTSKKEVRETNRQWAIRLLEWRNSEKIRLDQLSPDDVNYEYRRGRWSAVCDILQGEFTKKLLEEAESALD